MMRDDLLSHLAPLPAPTAPAGRPTATPATASSGAASSATAKADAPLFGADGFSFADLIDIVNPLQHIPIVASVYRHLTGDAIAPGSRVAGGALYGGVIGAVLGGANAIVEEATGKDAGELVLSMLTGDSVAPDSSPATVAEGAPKTASGAAPLPTVPDLALLGALPPEVLAGTPATPPPSTVPAATPAMASTLIDLAQLAPLPAVAPAAIAQARPGAVPTAPDGDDQGDPATGTATAPDAVPDGAVAANGGWFVLTMIEALDKYKAAAQLAADTRTPGPAAQHN